MATCNDSVTLRLPLCAHHPFRVCGSRIVQGGGAVSRQTAQELGPGRNRQHPWRRTAMKGLVLRRLAPAVAVVALLAFASVPHGSAAGVIVSGGAPVAAVGLDHSLATTLSTTTPIKHLVVIFQENVSFDHYFGTYPYAANPPGEPVFKAKTDTPSVNGLTQDLLTNNPNLANPSRLDRSQALTCDQNHDYTPEQQAFDHGLMDKFVQFTSGSSCPDKNIVMDYYDGNTVTAL